MLGVNEVEEKLFGPLHKAVAPAVEEDPSNVTEVIVQFKSLSAPALTFGFGVTVKVPEPLPLQSLPSVTITEYDPATLVVKLATSPGLLAPLGTVHAYENGVAVLPVTVAVIVAGRSLAQTVGEFTDNTGFEFTVSVVDLVSPAWPHEVLLVTVTATVCEPAVREEV